MGSGAPHEERRRLAPEVRQKNAAESERVMVRVVCMMDSTMGDGSILGQV